MCELYQTTYLLSDFTSSNWSILINNLVTSGLFHFHEATQSENGTVVGSYSDQVAREFTDTWKALSVQCFIRVRRCT